VADATARTSARERGVLAQNPESKENEGAEPSHRRTVGGMGDTGRAGLQEQRGERGTPSGKAGAGEGQATIRAGTPIESVEHTESEQMGISRCAREPRATNGFWADAEWLHCVDGKARPTQPGLFPLAHGATARVGRLRAYGNCIVAPQAAEFIRAYMSLSVSASEL
jgi:DNA (cytosine-5)-methyltransferase 1